MIKKVILLVLLVSGVCWGKTKLYVGNPGILTYDSTSYIPKTTSIYKEPRVLISYLAVPSGSLCGICHSTGTTLELFGETNEFYYHKDCFYKLIDLVGSYINKQKGER